MNSAHFSVGINYWPGRSPATMWHAFDDGAVRDDLAHIAALGFDAVRCLVRWDALQPKRDALDSATLDRLERFVTLAADAGLRVMPALCGAIGEHSFMPAWSRTLRDLYSGPLLAAQLAIARAAGERIAAHDNVVAWDLGHAFTAVRAARAGMRTSGEHASEPVAERDIAAWSSAVAKELRAVSIAATAGAYDGDLTQDTSVRFGSLCAPFPFASIQGANERLPFARGPFDPEALPFLAMLTAAFSFKPVLASGIASPTFPHQREAENAAYATAVLERLHADGRLGAYWWCWADDPEQPPYEPLAGIIRAGGGEKPVAVALSAFARERRPVVRAADMPMISSTYYYRTLPDSAQTLYEAFLGFVAARR